MNDPAPLSAPQAAPSHDFFAVIVFCILLGVLMLQIGTELHKLERRVTRLEVETTTIERRTR